MPSNYESHTHSFSVLAKAAFHASAVVQGTTTASVRLFLGSYLFGRITCHSLAILKLCPGNELAAAPVQLFDIPSTATLARSLVEAYYTFYYHAVEPVDDAEQDFRLTLARFSADTQRLRMLKNLGAEATEDEARDLEIAWKELVANPAFQSLTPEFRRLLAKGGRARYLDFSQLNDRLGIDQGFFRATWDYLSSEAHALPHSIIEAVGRNTGSAPAQSKKERLSLILHHSSLFLSLSLSQFSALFPSTSEQISGEAQQIVRDRIAGLLSPETRH